MSGAVSPTEVRLECLRLAVEHEAKREMQAAPEQIVAAASAFAAFVFAEERRADASR